MLKGKKVLFRAMSREDLERLVHFNNDVAVEVAGGGDPPLPQALARLQAEFDENSGKGGRDGTGFAVEADKLRCPGGIKRSRRWLRTIRFLFLFGAEGGKRDGERGGEAENTRSRRMVGEKRAHRHESCPKRERR